MGKLHPAIQYGRKILNHAPSPPKSALGQAGMYAGVGIASGTTNNLINHRLVEKDKQKQKQAYMRGKVYGRITAKKHK